MPVKSLKADELSCNGYFDTFYLFIFFIAEIVLCPGGKGAALRDEVCYCETPPEDANCGRKVIK